MFYAKFVCWARPSNVRVNASVKGLDILTAYSNSSAFEKAHNFESIT